MVKEYQIGKYFKYTALVDEEATREWYDKSEEWQCDCAYCRNFITLAQERRLPEDVHSLLDTLKIPPEKATYVCMLHNDGGRLLYDFNYRVAGRIVKGENSGRRDEVTCGHDTYPPKSFPKPHFDLQFFYALPYVLEEALD